jgi:adenylosuccinate synthase
MTYFLIPLSMRMPNSYDQVAAVVGLQWGDEAKGKLVDVLAEEYDVIARGAGGANAGHSIYVDTRKFVFRLMPSGALHEGKDIVLGGSMVLDLETLRGEVENLRNANIDVMPRLHIAGNAHVLFETHKDIDRLQEQSRIAATGKGIGTTKSGIGPAYMTKAERSGVQVSELMGSEESLIRRTRDNLLAWQHRYGIHKPTHTLDREIADLVSAQREFKERINPNMVDWMREKYQAGARILVEGAQAHYLDLDHGTYPYVTSSNTTVAAAMHSLGLPPQVVNPIGVAKAYCTRVGEGEFPTEATGATEQRLRDRGGEYGAVTKRPRRCGWLHIPDIKRAAFANGCLQPGGCLNLTKLDVLDEEDTIPVGIGNAPDGSVLYTELPGWKQSTAGITRFEDLPLQAQEFVLFVEKAVGSPIRYIGTGQKRQEMIVR